MDKLKKIIAILVLLVTCNLYSQSIESEHVTAQLISEVESIQPGKPFWAAIKLVHEQHWHTYWRNAGDSGLPTSIKWLLPKGFNASEIYWPYPQKINVGGTANFGYEGEILLLVRIQVPENFLAGSIVTLKARCDWLVCKETCQPGGADLSLTLHVRKTKPKFSLKWKKEFDKTRANLPMKSEDWKFDYVVDDNSVVINAKYSYGFNKNPGKIIFFPYEGGIFNNAAGQKLTKTKNGFNLEVLLEKLRVKDPEALSGILISDNGWLQLNSNKKALEIFAAKRENKKP